MEKGLHEKTGKSLEEWIGILKKENLARHGEMVKFLKSEHGITHGYANFVAIKTREAEEGTQTSDELVKTQYEKKEILKPIYDKLISELSKFAVGMEIAPKKASVSLRGKRQFALIQPTTKTRVDLGLKFNNKPVGGRLENSGPFGAMCTHRVQLTHPDEVDEEVMGWVREAWEESC